MVNIGPIGRKNENSKKFVLGVLIYLEDLCKMLVK